MNFASSTFNSRRRPYRQRAGRPGVAALGSRLVAWLGGLLRGLLGMLALALW